MSKALREAEGQWIYDFILLAVHTGMRRGEILGLKWENVNLDDGNIYVMHVLSELETKDYY